MTVAGTGKSAPRGFYWGEEMRGWKGLGSQLSYGTAWTLFRCLFRLAFRWRVCNPERVPQRGPVLLASNHASLLDPPLVGSGVCRLVHMLARDTLFNSRVVGLILRSWQAVPVDRDGRGAAGVKRIMDCLAGGGAVLVFPEGTRTRDGHLQPARSGVGLIALRSGAPVVPVRLFGTFEALSRERRLPRCHQIVVKYGLPLDLDPLRAESATCSKARLKEIYQQVTDEIMRAIARLQPCVDKTRFP